MSGFDLSLLLSFISVTFLLVITPGATTAVVIRSALAGGSRAGMATAAGAAFANSTIALGAGVGLGLLLQRWPSILFALRLGGAGYLVWLACASFRRVWRQSPASWPGGDATNARDAPAFRQGVMVNLLNPPIITFLSGSADVSPARSRTGRVCGPGGHPRRHGVGRAHGLGRIVRGAARAVHAPVGPTRARCGCGGRAAVVSRLDLLEGLRA
ncbi:MAG TPA: LysE family transporter [Vicinamibacterales bacterium]